MATVLVQVAGGDIQEKEADTLGELKRMLSAQDYQAVINKGETVDDDGYVFENCEFVALTKKTKGA